MHWLPLICALSGAPVGVQDGAAPVQQAAPPSSPAPSGSADDQDVVILDDVLVAGRRGAATVAPEREWSADDIDALGAYDIGETLARISESLGLDDPPMVIVNGRRVVDARNFLGFPPDALVRVEALPPQAAAIYGGDPARRVLNIVLQPEFRSRDGFVNGSRPTAGGSSSLAVDGRQSEIHDTATVQFGLQASRVTALRSDERPDYSRDHPGSDGTTLRPAVDMAAANLALTGAVGEWAGAFSANAQVQSTRFASGFAGPVAETIQETRDLSVNGGLSGQVSGWSVRLGMDGLISRTGQGGAVDLQADSLSAAVNLSADRSLIDLPAGPLLATASGIYARARSVTESGSFSTRQTTQSLDLSGALTAPLAAAGAGDLGVGDLSLSLGGRIRTLDEDGEGGGVNASLSWAPVSAFNVSGRWSTASDSPTRQQRLDPVLYGPPRTVYDFLTGESVVIAPLLGGNPDLRAQESEGLALAASVGPFGPWGLQMNIGFTRDSLTDGIGALPALTPATEAAFPERFIRDDDGRLVSIDLRPINLAMARSETLSSGLILSIPIQGDGPAGGRIGSLQVALNHTWQLTNVVVISDALPALDRLAGDGGGIPRHQVNLRLDGRYRNWGLNALASWRSGSRIRRDLGQDGPEDLRLSAFPTFDLKLSYLLEIAPAAGSDGAGARRDTSVRLGLEVDNLFDSRPEARVGDAPAPGYGRDDQDPLGRVVRLTLSRRF